MSSETNSENLQNFNANLFLNYDGSGSKEHEFSYTYYENADNVINTDTAYLDNVTHRVVEFKYDNKAFLVGYHESYVLDSNNEIMLKANPIYGTIYNTSTGGDSDTRIDNIAGDVAGIRDILSANNLTVSTTAYPDITNLGNRLTTLSNNTTASINTLTTTINYYGSLFALDTFDTGRTWSSRNKGNIITTGLPKGFFGNFKILKTITFQAARCDVAATRVPLYLNLWYKEGSEYKYLASSHNTVNVNENSSNGDNFIDAKFIFSDLPIDTSKEIWMYLSKTKEYGQTVFPTAALNKDDEFHLNASPWRIKLLDRLASEVGGGCGAAIINNNFDYTAPENTIVAGNVVFSSTQLLPLVTAEGYSVEDGRFDPLIESSGVNEAGEGIITRLARVEELANSGGGANAILSQNGITNSTNVMGDIGDIQNNIETINNSITTIENDIDVLQIDTSEIKNSLYYIHKVESDETTVKNLKTWVISPNVLNLTAIDSVTIYYDTIPANTEFYLMIQNSAKDASGYQHYTYGMDNKPGIIDEINKSITFYVNNLSFDFSKYLLFTLCSDTNGTQVEISAKCVQTTDNKYAIINASDTETTNWSPVFNIKDFRFNNDNKDFKLIDLTIINNKATLDNLFRYNSADISTFDSSKDYFLTPNSILNFGYVNKTDFYSGNNLNLSKLQWHYTNVFDKVNPDNTVVPSIINNAGRCELRMYVNDSTTIEWNPNWIWPVGYIDDTFFQGLTEPGLLSIFVTGIFERTASQEYVYRTYAVPYCNGVIASGGGSTESSQVKGYSYDIVNIQDTSTLEALKTGFTIEPGVSYEFENIFDPFYVPEFSTINYNGSLSNATVSLAGIHFDLGEVRENSIATAQMTMNYVTSFVTNPRITWPSDWIWDEEIQYIPGSASCIYDNVRLVIELEYYPGKTRNGLITVPSTVHAKVKSVEPLVALPVSIRGVDSAYMQTETNVANSYLLYVSREALNNLGIDKLVSLTYQLRSSDSSGTNPVRLIVYKPESAVAVNNDSQNITLTKLGYSGVKEQPLGTKVSFIFDNIPVDAESAPYGIVFISVSAGNDTYNSDSTNTITSVDTSSLGALSYTYSMRFLIHTGLTQTKYNLKNFGNNNLLYLTTQYCPELNFAGYIGDPNAVTTPEEPVIIVDPNVISFIINSDVNSNEVSLKSYCTSNNIEMTKQQMAVIFENPTLTMMAKEKNILLGYTNTDQAEFRNSYQYPGEHYSTIFDCSEPIMIEKYTNGSQVLTQVTNIRIPQIISIPRTNTMLAFAEARFGGATDYSGNVIISAISKDNGLTWGSALDSTKAFDIITPSTDGSNMNPCPAWDETNNRVMLVYQHYNTGYSWSSVSVYGMVEEAASRTTLTNQQTYFRTWNPVMSDLMSGEDYEIDSSTFFAHETMITNNDPEAYPDTCTPVKVRVDRNYYQGYGTPMIGPTRGFTIKNNDHNSQGLVVFPFSALTKTYITASAGYTRKEPGILCYDPNDDSWFTVVGYTNYYEDARSSDEMSGCEVMHNGTSYILMVARVTLSSSSAYKRSYALTDLRQYKGLTPENRVETITATNTNPITGLPSNGCQGFSIYDESTNTFIHSAPNYTPSGSGFQENARRNGTIFAMNNADLMDYTLRNSSTSPTIATRALVENGTELTNDGYFAYSSMDWVPRANNTSTKVLGICYETKPYPNNTSVNDLIKQIRFTYCTPPEID